MKVSTILDHVEYGDMTLPEFQRGYVWSRNQVRGLFSSLYRKYPIGVLLVWTTEVDPSWRRDESDSPGVVKLLLDGQQRITSLYGVMRGRPPRFFQGNERAFTDLYFNLRDETFEFYGPIKMRDDPMWISVTQLFEEGVVEMLTRVAPKNDDWETTLQYQQRLGRIVDIRDRELYIDEITGSEKSIDEVVEIFNRVNSAGTKLSKGDLALARISADRPAARNELRSLLDKWEHAGYSFKLDWLLRSVTAVATGQARFTALRGITPEEFEAAISRTEAATNYLLNLISDRLGLDHDRVLGGRAAFGVLTPLVDAQGGVIVDEELQRKLLYWYINSFMWGRYSGSTETRLQRDLEALSTSGVDGLIDELRLMRTNLDVRPEDLDSWSTGARLYPVLYMMTRVGGARDLLTGMGLSAAMLGKQSALHIHHVFPKKRLYEAGFKRSQVNALGNFSFLTAASNLRIGATLPHIYLAEVAEALPGALASQWIPEDPELWQVSRYLDFLEARRHLMASAINDFLVGLLSGDAPHEAPPTPRDAPAIAVVEDEDDDLTRIVAVCRELGLASPEMHFEVVDPESGELLAMADLAWPEGVQEEMTEPVAYLSEPDADMEERLNELGYRFFTAEARLIWYLEELVGFDIDGDDVVGEPTSQPGGPAGQSRPGTKGQPNHVGPWTDVDFWAHAEAVSSRECMDAIRQLHHWATGKSARFFWGEGRRHPSMTAWVMLGSQAGPVWTCYLLDDDRTQLGLNFEWLLPRVDESALRQLADDLRAIPAVADLLTGIEEASFRRRPSVPVASVLRRPSNIDVVLRAYDRLVDTAR